MKLLGKTPQTRRIVFALGLAFASVTGGAYAQPILNSDVSTALAALNHTLTTSHPAKPAVFLSATDVTISAAQLQTLIQNITSNSGAGTYDLPGNAAADITNILQVVNYANSQGDIGATGAAVPAAIPDLLAGAWTGLKAEGNTTIAADLPAVVEALDTDANYSSYTSLTEAARDADETTTVTAAITDAKAVSGALTPQLFGNIIASGLLGADDTNPVAQAALVASAATTANLTASGETLSQLGAEISSTDAAVLTSTGSFLETFTEVKEGTSAASAEGFLEGFTSTETPAQLALTGSSIIANTPSAIGTGPRESVFIGLVTSGSAQLSATSGATTANLNSLVNGVAYQILSGQNYGGTPAINDAARATLAGDLISVGYGTYEESIASAGASSLSDSLDDAFAYTKALDSVTVVKNTDVAGVAAAIANVFTLGDITSTSGNLNLKVAVAQGAIKAVSADAGAVASAVANQVLTSGSGNQAILTFLGNFIGGVDTADSSSGTIADTLRSATALGLAKAADAAQIANGAAIISASAVATDPASATTINAVAQPILNYYYSLSNTTSVALALSTGTESESVAVAVAQTSGTYNPAYLSAQLILKAESGTKANPLLVDQIAFGTATSTAITAGFGSADAYVTALTGDLTSTTALPLVLDYLPALITSGSFGSVETATDAAATGGAPAAETGTIAAIIALTDTNHAVSIAYAVAHGGDVSTDPVREIISEDVVKNVAGVDVALSGSVGTLIAVNDKPAFAADVTGLALGDYSSIALAVANSVPSTLSTVATAIANIEESVVGAGTGTPNKNLANIEAVTENLAENYTGDLAGGATTLDYQNAAVLTQLINTKYGATTAGLNIGLADALVPYEIGVSGDNSATAALISGSFASALPGNTANPNVAVAIANLATASSLYGGTLNAEATGAIGAAISAVLPSTTGPVLSGSVALVVAENATLGAVGTGHDLDDNLSTVAGVFATSSVPSADFLVIAKDLGSAAMANPNQDGADITLAAIGSAFAPGLVSSATNLEALAKELLALDTGNITGLGYIYGAIDEAAGGFTTAEITSIKTDLLADGLTSAEYTAFLSDEGTDVSGDQFANINPDETPTLNF